MSTLNRDFIKACKHNNLGLVKLCLRLGADIHAHKDYVLQLAAMNGHREVVAYLQSLE